MDILFNANDTGIKNSVKRCNRYSAIHCPTVKERVSDQANNTEPSVAASTKIQESPRTEVPKKETDKKEDTSTKSAPSSKPQTKKLTEKPAIAAFFAKHQVKNPSEKKETVPIKVVPSKRVAREPSDDEETTERTTTQKRLRLADDAKSEKSDSLTKLKSKSKAKTSKISTSKDTGKKRKRIQQISDSESSEEEKEEGNRLTTSNSITF